MNQVAATAWLTGSLLAAGLAGAVAAPSDLAVAWRRDSGVETRTADGAVAPAQIELGSLWKLFVYAYAADNQLAEPPYQCVPRGRPVPRDEEYCCDPGGSVGRDDALAQSCGPYFRLERLGIPPAAWRRYWAGRIGYGSQGAAWLLDTSALRPEQTVTLLALFDALDAISPPARQAAREALLRVALDGYGREALPQLGAGLRYKTYSWRHSGRPGVVFGGGAGWLVDGTPFWFGATGSSRSVLNQQAAALARLLPAVRTPQGDAETACVIVDYFTRYPLRRVLAADGREAAPGPLQGRFRAEFVNGQAIDVVSRGELTLRRQGRNTDGSYGLQITGRFGLNEYVARVVDREADAREVEAARALAIAARSYLEQNAAVDGRCYHITDDSRTQRVSPQPATTEARAAAWFSDGLVLRGAPVRYHSTNPAPGRMAWTAAVAAARQGRRFDQLLTEAFPRAALASLAGTESCRRQPEAERWLAAMEPKWRRRLETEAGFEAVADTLSVCALGYGVPYSDQRRLRIHLRDWKTFQGRLTLAHEYLHLAFRFHPRGQDEDFVETWARKLIDG